MLSGKYFQLTLIFTLTYLLACVPNQTLDTFEGIRNSNPVIENSNPAKLSENHGRIDLSLDTMEQQTIDKANAAKKLSEARDQRMIVDTDPNSELPKGVNIASFARSTKNDKGEKIYARNLFHSLDHWTECNSFRTSDSAQRFLLNNGGPELDSRNLDPDGDGFACNWNPSVYRQLIIPNN